MRAGVNRRAGRQLTTCTDDEPMDRTGMLAAGFRCECEEDYVGLRQISREVGPGATLAEHAERIIDVVRAMMDDGGIMIGQFEDGAFIEWPTPPAEIVDRLRDELTMLGREPDIGDVAWLAARF
jgi:hypothetical protein